MLQLTVHLLSSIHACICYKLELSKILVCRKQTNGILVTGEMSSFVDWLREQWTTHPFTIVLPLTLISLIAVIISICIMGICCTGIIVYIVKRRREGFSRREYQRFRPVMTDEDEEQRIEIDSTVYYGGAGAGGGAQKQHETTTHRPITDEEMLSVRMALKHTPFEFVRVISDMGKFINECVPLVSWCGEKIILRNFVIEGGVIHISYH